MLAIAVCVLVVASQALAASNRPHWADGYVWGYDPLDTSYNAGGFYAFNRTGRAITIKRPAGTTGRYVVKFNGLSGFLGARSTLHVTGYQSTDVYCAPRGARLVNSAVEVRCFDASTNAPANEYFTAYVTRNYDDLAFAYGNKPTAGSYAPAASASWNPSGGAMTVTRSGVGQYLVKFKGLGTLAGTEGGHVQVNGVAAGMGQCKVGSWGGSPDMFVSVRCLTREGNPFDAKFNVLFVLPSEHLAYAWANEPASASYTPSSFYSSNPAGGGVTITRSGTGEYNVEWTGAGAEFLDGGDVQVTAYGGGTAQCKVVGWGGDDVGVHCFAPNGAPVDSFYTILYAS